MVIQLATLPNKEPVIPRWLFKSKQASSFVANLIAPYSPLFFCAYVMTSGIDLFH